MSDGSPWTSPELEPELEPGSENMESPRKRIDQTDNASCNEAEKRRENRLTTIIDQLLINKSRTNDPQTPVESDEGAVIREADGYLTKHHIGSKPEISLVVGEGQTESETNNVTEAPGAGGGGTAPTPTPKSRKKRVGRGGGEVVNGLRERMSAGDIEASPRIKSERFSPEMTEGSRSGSPDSARNRTPSSFPGTPPERGSPAGQPALKQMEQMMNRNYSDFMRSLAAKYNNSNPNDYFSTPSRNGFLGGLDSRFPFKTATPLLGLAPLAATSAAAAVATATSTSSTAKDGGDAKKNDLHQQQSPLLAGAANFNALNSFPLIDMSSTQALINMVRSASAQSASQLETYLKGAIKRPSEASTSPLDLSSSVSKKLRTDTKCFLSSGGSVYGAFRQGDLSVTPTTDVLKKERKSVSPRPKTAASATVNSAGSASSSSSGGSGSLLGAHTPCLSLCTDKPCSSENQTVSHWTVDDVCQFVSSIDICAEYAEKFREQSIDGVALPLLTEDHLINNISMKLGPALKLRAVLARRLGHCAICLHCVHCHGNAPPHNASTNGLRPSSTGNEPPQAATPTSIGSNPDNRPVSG